MRGFSYVKIGAEKATTTTTTTTATTTAPTAAAIKDITKAFRDPLDPMTIAATTAQHQHQQQNQHQHQRPAPAAETKNSKNKTRGRLPKPSDSPAVRALLQDGPVEEQTLGFVDGITYGGR